jgi:hypothetical protein
VLDAAARKAGLKLVAPARKAILSALAERDETAAICRDADGNPEPDPELRDTESVPLPAGEDPADGEVVAEKLEAMVSLGVTNSRMKDFYDVYVLASRFAFEGPTLASAVRATFLRRRTPRAGVAWARQHLSRACEGSPRRHRPR